MGQLAYRYTIVNISAGCPCIVTTSEALELVTGDSVRMTNLNDVSPHAHGSDQLNAHKYVIRLIDSNNFYIFDPITGLGIDATVLTPYISGGTCNKVEDEFVYS